MGQLCSTVGFVFILQLDSIGPSAPLIVDIDHYYCTLEELRLRVKQRQRKEKKIAADGKGGNGDSALALA